MTLAGIGVLGAAGAVGGGYHPERYDGWHVVITPAGGDAVRFTTTFDQDFGDEQRHGPELRIDDDLGAAVDVTASSPDAPDDLDVMYSELIGRTRIRIGDPDTTISGQHRYTLAYTLPEAILDGDQLVLDILNGDDGLETDQVTVVFSGFELEAPRCVSGRIGGSDPCEIVHEPETGLYVADIGAIEAGIGVSVDARVVGTHPPAEVNPPPLPDRRGDMPRVLGAGLGALGLASAVPVYMWAKRRGRNEVFAGGAADAAFGELPPPGADTSKGVATRLVTDDELAELATTEFAPPDGIDPWEAAVLLSERFGSDTVADYLSGLAGKEVITLTEVGGDLAIGKGPKYSLVTDPGEAEMLEQIWRLGDPYVAKGTYNSGFAAAWKNISTKLAKRIDDSGWWKRGTPSSSSVADIGLVVGVLAAFGGVAILLGAASAGVLKYLKYWPVAIGFALVVPAIIALAAYATMLPARSAVGSALALRAESFRRFLEASEGRHVEWAWQHGLLREYSAWAVALGASEAWSKALAAANVPEPERLTTPMLIYRHRSDLNATHTKPSSSGSSGGRSGGFSAGRVGGGGGGVSRGSW